MTVQVDPPPEAENVWLLKSGWHEVAPECDEQEDAEPSPRKLTVPRLPVQLMTQPPRSAELVKVVTAAPFAAVTVYPQPFGVNVVMVDVFRAYCRA